MEYISRLIFEGDSIQIGEWRCYPDSQLWAEENIAGNKPMVVFPRSAVQIQQSGRDVIVTSPNHVVFYNKDQTYRRGLASRRGDICEYVYIDPNIVAEMQSTLGLPISHDINSPFQTSQGPCHTEAFLIQRALCKQISESDGPLDPLLVEESFLTILPRLILDSNHGAPTKSHNPKKSSTIEKRRLQIETAKEYLNKNLSHSVSLSSVATACESSAFHISRVFKQHVGVSIFQYLISLRLRNAFERIIDSSNPLTKIAFESGFSSQSHMTNLFTREFGVPPSFVRKNKPVEIIRRVLKRHQHLYP